MPTLPVVDHDILNKLQERAAQENCTIGELLTSLLDTHEQASLRAQHPQPGNLHPLLMSIVEHSEDAIISKSMDGSILSWNNAAEKIYGYSAAEAIGQPITLIIPPEMPDEFAMIMERLKQGDVIEHYETTRQRKDGIRITISLTVSPIRDTNDHMLGASAIARDITQQKQSEEAYRSLVEHALQGLVIIQDGSLVFANLAIARISGYSVEELLALSAEEISAVVHPDDRPAVLQSLEDRLAGKDVNFQQIFRFIKKGGVIRWVETFASRVVYLGKPAVQVAYVDITERKQAEEALELSEDRYRAVINSMVDAFYLLESSRNHAGEIIDFRIVEINENATHQMDMGREALVGGLISELLPFNHTDGYFKEYKRVVETGETLNHELQVLEGDAARGWYHRHVVKVGDGVRVVTQDITARKVAQEILRLSEARYRAIAEHFPNGLVALYDHDLRYTVISGEGLRKIGMTSADLEGKRLRDFFPKFARHPVVSLRRPLKFRPQRRNN